MKFLLALCLLVLIAALSACASTASLPECQKPEASIIQYEGKTYALIDLDNLKKLAERSRGIRDGTCKE